MLFSKSMLALCFVLASPMLLTACDDAAAPISEPTPPFVKGAMVVDGKTYKLTSVKAIKIMSDGKDAVAVIVSPKPFVVRDMSLFPSEEPRWISLDSIHLANTPWEFHPPIASPHLQVLFDAKTGQRMMYQGYVQGWSYARSDMGTSSVWNGEARIEGKTIVGTAKYERDEKSKFDFEFKASVEEIEFGNDLDEDLAEYKLRKAGGHNFYLDPFKETIKEGKNADHVRCVGFDEDWRGGDEGLKYLKYLPKLSTIYLAGHPKITEKALSEITRALPNVTVEQRSKFYLGINGMPAVGGDALLVTEVARDSPADEYGLKKGDLIKQFDNAPIKEFDDLAKALNSTNKSDVKLTVVRNDKSIVVRVKLASWW